MTTVSLDPEAAFCALLEASPFAVCLIDAAGGVVTANAAGEALLCDERVAPGLHRLTRGVLERGRPDELDCVAAADDGERHLRARCHPVGVDGAILVVEDATLATRLAIGASTDPLTGAANQGEFQRRLREEIARATRQRLNLALAVIDVDHFKAVNDTFGHLAGDRVLRRVADCLRASVRESDVVARMGGDELALLMTECNMHEGAATAERARAAIEAADLDDGVRITISVGVASAVAGQDADDLVREADRALYRAKRAGRNTVRTAGDQRAPESPHQSHTASAVRALARAIDLKDASTQQHSDRVAELAGRVAEELRWPAERVRALREAAIIHDVGKVGVPDHILLKPDRLTSEEYALVKEHARLGAEIAGEVLTGEQTAWLRAHHERIDGLGYPDGLTGSDIPEGARILAVVDAFDVMTSHRSYSPARPPLEAISELERGAGTQFDPHIVEMLRRPRFMRYVSILRNQLVARDANDATGGELEIICECGNPDCFATLTVTTEELAAVHAHARRFVIAAGHTIEDVERTVARTDRFEVVEKLI